MNYNFTREYQKFKDLDTLKNNKKPGAKAPPKFRSDIELAHIVPILAAVKPVPVEGTTNPHTGKCIYSPSATLASIEDDKKYITINDDIYLGSQIKDAFRLLAYTDRGSLITGSMTQNPYFGTLTPIALLAFRDHHNVGYNQWDKSDKFMGVFLGKGLAGLCLINTVDKWHVIRDDVKAYIEKIGIDVLRDEALTTKSGSKAGTKAGNTSNKMNLSISEWGSGLSKTDVKLAQNMLLQTWLANASLRTDSMILDPWDWEAEPEAFDALEEEVLASSSSFMYKF